MTSTESKSSNKRLNIVLFLFSTLLLFSEAAIISNTTLLAQTLQAAAKSAPDGIECCNVLDYRDKNGKPVFGLVAYVDLSRVSPIVPTIKNTACKNELPNPSFTGEIAAAAYPDITLSVNANFFDWDRKNFNAHDAACTRAIGLAVDKGKLISLLPEKGKKGQGINGTEVLPDSILFYGLKKPPQIIEKPDSSYPLPADVKTAVSGIMIAKGGKNVSYRANGANIDNDMYTSRTALGLTADKKTLMVVIIEGGVPRSAGITLSNLADKLIALGADTVLNLDGGGSSAFNYYAGTDYQVMSLPKDFYPQNTTFRQYRPGPIQLAFRAITEDSLLDRLVMGTPVFGDTAFKGNIINALGTFSFVSQSSLLFHARDQINILSDSAVITNRPGAPAQYNSSFHAETTGQSPSAAPIPTPSATPDTRINGIAIDSKGKVGIGTTTPASIFDVWYTGPDNIPSNVFGVKDDGSMWTVGPIKTFGGIKGMKMSPLYVARREKTGEDPKIMTSVESSICFLTKFYENGSFGACQIDQFEGNWRLTAISYKNNEIECMAYCLTGIPFEK